MVFSIVEYGKGYEVTNPHNDTTICFPEIESPIDSAIRADRIPVDALSLLLRLRTLKAYLYVGAGIATAIMLRNENIKGADVIDTGINPQDLEIVYFPVRI
ncbi:MAG: hypothetical protein WCO33_02235 [bacterium]